MRLIRAKLRKIRVQKHFKIEFYPIFRAYNQLIILDFILLKNVTEMHMFSTILKQDLGVPEVILDHSNG